MQYFTSYSSLTNAIQNKLNETVNKKVTPLIIKSLKANIKSEVYNAYTPVRYRRRKGASLLSNNNFHNISTQPYMTVVTNTATPNSSIIHGKSYSYTTYKDTLLRWVEGYKRRGNTSYPSILWKQFGYSPSQYPFMKKRKPVAKTQQEANTGDLNTKIISTLKTALHAR